MSAFCPKNVDLTSVLTIHSGYNSVLADSDWDELKIDLTSENTFHSWTLQAGFSVVDRPTTIHEIMKLNLLAFFQRRRNIAG